ncbi:tetratricopeptide (TPR) repeat protein [Stakelama sediminis]|uniref:Tetratricopeptide (TPR) repeat protein n=1 Tax=Stakelama sediminis TaxID=463200 RepID=A0A840YVE3_9SPHN|nr:tetratricopeptide repeat-containing sulfotransferase family protein [Stakelama sediminis]MBB5717618.1 tetratricopeptide (TPR) repeat protein [Stakelama sediminis]
MNGALKIAEEAISSGDDFAPLLSFAGLVSCQLGDPSRGVEYLRPASAALPEDLSVRRNLVTALIETGQWENAEKEATAVSEDISLRRLAAYVQQHLGKLTDAAKSYEYVLAQAQNDFQSWNNLANIRSALGDRNGAIDCLYKAMRLAPGEVPLQKNLAYLLNDAERFEERFQLLRRTRDMAPLDAEVLTEFARAAASVQRLEQAESAFADAIAANKHYLPAYLELGMLFENLNRLDALYRLADLAEENGLPEAEVRFLKAWALFRQGRAVDALPLAENAADTINPVRRSHLIAGIAERLGDTDKAFAAYSDMNRAAVEARPQAPFQAAGYLEEVRAYTAQLEPKKLAGWTTVSVPKEPASPIFIVGFPRSGTTLLDTLLMNLPDVHVLEEQMVLRPVETMLGDIDRIATLTQGDIVKLRNAYFDALRIIASPEPGQTVIDKFPLHMVKMPLIHRIFPDAKVVFVERHPCDVVLSCFMANFQLNRAMANFTTLEDAARLYDAAQSCWTLAERNLPLNVHRIRYERMVSDLEGEMRPLLKFLDIDWDPAVLDNQASAARRGQIKTASYSQVTEPLYTRASGRWERYRHHLEPVLPTLKPWAKSMEYDL